MPTSTDLWPAANDGLEGLVEFARALLRNGTAHAHAGAELTTLVSWLGCESLWVAQLVDGGETLHSVMAYQRDGEVGGLAAAAARQDGHRSQPQTGLAGASFAVSTDPSPDGSTAAAAPSLAWQALLRDEAVYVWPGDALTGPSAGPSRALADAVGVVFPLRRDGQAWGVLEAHWQAPHPAVATGLSVLELVGLLVAARHPIGPPNLDASPSPRTLFDLLPACVAIHCDGHIVYANPMLASTLGHGSPSSLEGTALRDILRGDDLEAIEHHLGSGRGYAATPAADERYHCVDGSVAVIAFARFRVEFEGARCVCAVGFDVTSRRALDAKLTSVDRMASVGALAGGVAHEINNPLAAVLANVDFALEVLSKPGSEHDADDLVEAVPVLEAADLIEIREVLREVRAAAERIQRVVKDLRNLVNAPTGVVDDVELELIIRTALRAARAELRHKARIFVQLDKLPRIQADPMGLTQVLLNLLLNAAGAIPDGAIPDSHRVAVRGFLDAGQVVLEISDTGVGIAREHQQRIFDPYYTTKPLGEGTGLGLAVSQRIIAAHAGQLECESAVGMGSTFRIRLPVPVHGRLEPSAAVPERPRLMVIDDEPMVGQTIRRGLGRTFEITLFSSAVDALDELDGGTPYDIILCDLVLPNLSGKEFYELLKGRSESLARRVVFLTGGAYTAALRAFLEDVPNPQVEKPFRLAALRTMLSTFLEHLTDTPA